MTAQPRKRAPAKKTAAKKAPAKKTAAKKTTAKKAPAKRPVKKVVPPAPPPVQHRHHEEEVEEAKPSPFRRRRRKIGRITVSTTGMRDFALFFSGLGGVFYETVAVKTDRPTLLLLFAAMMGLPAFLRTDEHRK